MSKFIEDTKLIQKFAGVNDDGVFGPKTAEALVGKLGLSAQAPSATFKVCIDPGHGLGSRENGLFDPGCVNIKEKANEATIVLEWASALERALRELGIDSFLTRRTNFDRCPLQTRVARAVHEGCDALISIHVNDASNSEATGSETLYKGTPEFAKVLQKSLAAEIDIQDRGIVRRNELAVLAFNGPCALIEVGFIQRDYEKITNPLVIKRTCESLAKAVADYAKNFQD